MNTVGNENPATSYEDTPFAQLFNQPFTTWMQGVAHVQSESIRFLADRAAKDLRLPLRLAACGTPAQALGIAASFAFEAACDYLGESRKLIELTAGDFENAAATVI
jgi:hypothetical protein